MKNQTFLLVICFLVAFTSSSQSTNPLRGLHVYPTPSVGFAAPGADSVFNSTSIYFNEEQVFYLFSNNGAFRRVASNLEPKPAACVVL